MVPIVIDWKQDSIDEDGSTLEFPLLQPSFEVKEMKHYVDRQENKDISLAASENNGIAQSVSENNDSQENNQSVEANIGNINIVETSSEKDRSLEINSSKKRMQVRAKLNDLGGIIIPTAPDFSAAGSLKEWLHDGGDFHSPDETAIPRFGDSGSELNGFGSSSQPSSEEAELETYSFPVLSIDGKVTNEEEPSIYVGFGDSAVENKPWGHAPFDPELPASLDKDLEQLSQKE